MRVVRFEKFGGPEVLTETRVPAPRPGPGQVAIDVAYAGVNFADVKSRSDGYRVPSLPFVPGLEVSGWIRAVGDGVTGLDAGRPVAAFTPGGGYAETVVVDATTVFTLPDSIDLRTAATLPTVLPTAHALLHEAGRLRAGETVLVQGAAGGVGTVLGQLAEAAGAGRVFGVVSGAAKAEYALAHGYDEVFVGDFADEVRAATGGRGVDLALDPVGGETFRRSLEALAPFGRLVSYGNASAAEPWRLGQRELFPGAVSVAGFSLLTLVATEPEAVRALTTRAFRTVAEGTVRLPVTAEFPLAEAADAHRLMETRTTTGKLLLRVAG
ncbi:MULTISPECIES: quinone oxidoreductase family protein [Streptomyces]|uniref:quinone oxidoreductase family protein n=1 Tax=Streptomyces TaxID=1883 RepID=UPI00163C2D77|nr:MULTISPECIES: zinc-binding dehydrogenase [Streptomyces]MBC2878350.1 zinc-binding dehydrogenase [Streptomyces sp. TYQ1024]UBI40534.1 zinc-binding dehydrogenase [Streptomyces mobaraensis]UKW33116.1 zinc-binding dehydrogenase [Streptomyces sp. TYQ1024]